MARFNRQFRAKPIRHRPSNILQFEQKSPSVRKARGKQKSGRWLWAVLLASPLAGVGAVWLWYAVPDSSTGSVASLLSSTQAAEQFDENFGECSGTVRYTCVVDGDTFWLKGDKIRIADINAPEVSEPQCPAESQLGGQTTQRLIALLNGGGFSLQSVDRDEDQYGRKLRVVTRGGSSLGEVLVDEGLAERWKGYRGSWCQ